MPRRILRLGNRLTFGWFTRNHPSFFRNYFYFWRDLFVYSQLAPRNEVEWFNLQPCINDRTATSEIDYYYFYQDMWGARKIFEHAPARHVDIGSSVWFVGMLSQKIPVCSVDVRPLPVQLAGLETMSGDIRHLPFADNSVESISSLCVIEHIGLGRYGDMLDARGTEKAIHELTRVVSPGGNIYVSVPIDRADKTYFNANRAFERISFVNRFKPLKIVESKFIQGNRVYAAHEFDQLNLDKLVVGLFHFQK